MVGCIKPMQMCVCVFLRSVLVAGYDYVNSFTEV